MITYEKYVILRNARGLKDADVAKKAEIQQSIFSDWKRGKSMPKMENMVKIADALEMDYYEFMGPVGKFSSYRTDKPAPPQTKEELFDKELLRLYHNATSAAQQSVMVLLKNSQKEDSKSLREA